MPLCIDVAGIGDALRTVVASNGTYAPAAVEQMSARYHSLLEVISSGEDVALGQLFASMETVPVH